MNLNDLDDDEFADEMDENLGLENDWKQFLADSVIRRTGEALEELELKLQMQIRSHTGSGDGDWERRVGNKLSLVQFRLRQVRRQIHALDSGEARNERAWKLFAHELCEALEDSDLEPALDDIPTPFEGLTARQWLRRRQEKRGVVAA